MHITIHQESLLHRAAPLVVLIAWQDEPLPTGIAELFAAEDFQGKANQMLLLYPGDALPAQRLLLLGLGEQSAATPDTLRQAAAHAARKAHDLKLASLAMGLPTTNSMRPDVAAQVMSEGAELGLYTYLSHKSSLSDEQSHTVEQLMLVTDDHADDAQQGAARGAIIARGVMRARDLINAPGNVATPSYLGDVARELGERTNLKVDVFGLAELEQQGFGGLLAVSRGSAQTPRFIIMEHGSAAPGVPTICLVGKGVTFDTGGISIKPAEKMDAMKMDMGGAGAIFGTMQAIDELGLPLHVVGLVSAAENMPDGNAYKPGDVITTLSGKTVEILNTDAEGRIVLADALFYAQRYQPQAMIDVATLTGAMVVALGQHATGVMGNNQEVIERLIRAGEATAERVWQLPLWDDYRATMKSEIADLRNHGGRQGGAILAAAFLDAFVGEYPWAHLDIAGTAWSEGKPCAYCTQGATGVGVRLLVHMLTDWARAASAGATQ
jgi:leucyl aminopeptidase